MALIVLGAGATRGASFVNCADLPIPPPLDGDFFDLLPRLVSRFDQQFVNTVTTFRDKLFGHNAKVSMEEYFSTITQFKNIVDLTGRSQIPSDEIDKCQAHFIECLQALFAKSLTIDSTPLQCAYHRSLVENLTIDDCIISFNYDCLIDYSLVEFGSHCWNPHFGYPVSDDIKEQRKPNNYHVWEAKKQEITKHNSCRLLKLHGSLNFHFGFGDKFGLQPDAYTRYHLSESHCDHTSHSYDCYNDGPLILIPPVLNKEIRAVALRGFWQEAARQLAQTDSIIIIGYSFPPTDFLATALFRSNLVGRELDNLVIVNPCSSTTDRIRQLFSIVTSNDTRVQTPKTLQEFSSMPRQAWDSPGKQ